MNGVSDAEIENVVQSDRIQYTWMRNKEIVSRMNDFISVVSSKGQPNDGICFGIAIFPYHFEFINDFQKKKETK